jgi:hypothetical protein
MTINYIEPTPTNTASSGNDYSILQDVLSGSYGGNKSYLNEKEAYYAYYQQLKSQYNKLNEQPIDTSESQAIQAELQNIQQQKAQIEAKKNELAGQSYDVQSFDEDISAQKYGREEAMAGQYEQQQQAYNPTNRYGRNPTPQRQSAIGGSTASPVLY